MTLRIWQEQIKTAITKFAVSPLLARVSWTLWEGYFAFEAPSLKNKTHYQLSTQAFLYGLDQVLHNLICF